MTETLLISVSKSDLQTLITECVNSCLNHNRKESDNHIAEIIDRAELCKRLDISEPTVIRWEGKGKIPSLRVGDRVRYNWHKVLKALEQ